MLISESGIAVGFTETRENVTVVGRDEVPVAVLALDKAAEKSSAVVVSARA